MKLIATDLDGTFLNHFHISDKYSQLAIDQTLQNGHYFAICTGRHLHRNHQVGLKFLKSPIFKIAMNGALIRDVNDNIIYQQAIDESFIQQLEKQFPTVPFEWITASGVYVNRSKFEQFVAVLKRGMKIKVLVKQLFMLAVSNDIYYNQERNEPVLAIGARVGDLVVAEQLKQFINLNASFVTDYGPNAKTFEIVGNHVSKKEAVEWLANHLEIAYESVYVFGNDLNDVPMLDFFEQSYAVKNSVEQAKKAANFVIGSNRENAVAKKIIEIVNQ